MFHFVSLLSRFTIYNLTIHSTHVEGGNEGGSEGGGGGWV